MSNITDNIEELKSLEVVGAEVVEVDSNFEFTEIEDDFDSDFYDSDDEEDEDDEEDDYADYEDDYEEIEEDYEEDDNWVEDEDFEFDELE